MYGLAITLIAVGGLSFLLPLIGRQFILVTLFGLTGAGSAAAGFVILLVGIILLVVARNKVDSGSQPGGAVAIGENSPQPTGRQFFSVVGGEPPEPFTLTAIDFGQEAARLGQVFGFGQYEKYLERQAESNPNSPFLKIVQEEPNFLIMQFGALMTGAILGYVNVILKPEKRVFDEVLIGARLKIQDLYSEQSESVQNFLVEQTFIFTHLLIDEVREVAPDASLKRLCEDAGTFYRNKSGKDDLEVPAALAQYVSGLGSRFMAVCDSDFKIKLC